MHHIMFFFLYPVIWTFPPVLIALIEGSVQTIHGIILSFNMQQYLYWIWRSSFWTANRILPHYCINVCSRMLICICTCKAMKKNWISKYNLANPLFELANFNILILDSINIVTRRCCLAYWLQAWNLACASTILHIPILLTISHFASNENSGLAWANMLLHDKHRSDH